MEMRELAFKMIWPTEMYTLDWNLDDILLMQSRLNCSQNQEPTIESLGRLLDCEVSHNFRKTILYIGTNSSSKTLHKAHGILDSLFDLTVSSLNL